MIWLGVRHFSAAPQATNAVRIPSSRLPLLIQPFTQDWPIPPDVHVHRCMQWLENDTAPDLTLADPNYPYSAEASFELPVTSDTLFLVSRSLMRNHGGLFSGGGVEYVQSADISDSVKVDVTARFKNHEHLEASKACLLERNETAKGVGIFTKWDEGGHHNHVFPELHFKITVTFPSTGDGSPLVINKLSTDLEVYAQILRDLSGVEFKSMALKSALAPIFADSLVSARADVLTSMDRIEGTYNATKSLVLVTSNAPIDVIVNLIDNDDQDDSAPSRLKLLASNGYIQANVSLISTAESSRGGAFDVSARTSIAPLGLDVRSAPVDSLVTIDGSTSLGAAHVKLPTTFEGALSAHTSLAGMTVVFADGAEDPKGEGRARALKVGRVTPGAMSGAVGWSEDGMSRGRVDVQSSMAPVTIEL
ncbi:hypothetical protein C8J57DRAFT_1089397 [Mycena rebaudengoi]|nr:hypothetical protein C8J57DRAFT_1089397 [Mycena rebaudengoi]